MLVCSTDLSPSPSLHGPAFFPGLTRDHVTTCTNAARQANTLHELIFAHQAHFRLRLPTSELHPVHSDTQRSPAWMADSAPTSPSAPSRSTETPSDLAQNQAAHAIDPKASHRALQIPEILEHILVHLPFKDLFVHQRVSKTFQTSIAKSPAIRRKMFLALDKNTPLETWKLRKSDHKRGRGKHRWKFYPGTNDEPGITTPVTLNPMLEVTWPGSRSCARRKQSDGAEYVSVSRQRFSTGYQGITAAYPRRPAFQAWSLLEHQKSRAARP
jgi:hypothetical protein